MMVGRLFQTMVARRAHIVPDGCLTRLREGKQGQEKRDQDGTYRRQGILRIGAIVCLPAYVWVNPVVDRLGNALFH